MAGGDFGIVSQLLETAQKHSNTVGKVWIMVLFVFRIFVLVTATKEVWSDEQSNFLCDTNQPGCQLGCYDKTFPVSHVRFWMMQILFVSTPTLIYLGFKLHKISIEKKKGGTLNADQNLLQDENQHISKNDNEHDLQIQNIYVINIVSKILLELVFIIAQYWLYGFGLESMYTCESWPCLTKVFCYVSRPTEKTIFIIFMLIVAFVSLILNVAEMVYLYWKKKKNNEKEQTNNEQDSCSKTSYMKATYI